MNLFIYLPTSEGQILNVDSRIRNNNNNYNNYNNNNNNVVLSVVTQVFMIVECARFQLLVDLPKNYPHRMLHLRSEKVRLDSTQFNSICD